MLVYSNLPYSHPLLYISWGKVFVEVHHKFSKLFNIDNILWIFTLRIDDFGTASNLGEHRLLQLTNKESDVVDDP